MRRNLFLLLRALLVGAAALIAACAGFSGSNLKPGVSMLPDVVASMGEPAMRWVDAGGRQQLAYPRGPAATQTFMVFIDSAGRLERIEPVLTMAHFASIEPGRSDEAAVLRLIGPPQPHWTMYFKARDELAWTWRFCDSWNQSAFFDVLFDAPTGIVRSTQQRQDLSGWDGVAPSCGH